MTFQTASLEEVKQMSRYPSSGTVSGYEVVMDMAREMVWEKEETGKWEINLEKGKVDPETEEISRDETDDEYHSRVDRFVPSISLIEMRGQLAEFH